MGHQIPVNTLSNSNLPKSVLNWILIKLNPPYFKTYEKEYPNVQCSSTGKQV